MDLFEVFHEYTTANLPKIRKRHDIFMGYKTNITWTVFKQ